MRKTLLFLLLIAGGVWALFQTAVWKLSDGFTLSKISCKLSTYEGDMPDAFVNKILEQPFHYLDKGSQFYVFKSDDDQYVLKFFRLDRYRLPSFHHYLILPSFLSTIQTQRLQSKKDKLHSLRTSCKIAYEELREDCGLIYLHLNRTSHLHRTIRLYDKLEREYLIDGNDFAFYLQKRGEHVYPHLLRLLKENRKEEAKNAIADLIHLLNKRIEKNITDYDAVIHKNAGFLKEKPFFLDIGQFAKEKIEKPEEEIDRLTAVLYAWLKQKDPQLFSN